MENICFQITGIFKLCLKTVKINGHEPLRRILLRKFISVDNIHMDIRIFKQLSTNLIFQFSYFLIGNQPRTAQIHPNPVSGLTGCHLFHGRLFQ